MIYFKIIDNIFNGFYSDDIDSHRDILFKEDNVLNDGIYNISYEDWQELIKEEVLIFNQSTNTLEPFKIEQDKSSFVKPIFNYKTRLLEESATVEEQTKYWLRLMKLTQRDIKELDELGLQGGNEYLCLVKKLEEYKNNYMNSVHEEANIMNEQL